MQGMSGNSLKAHCSSSSQNSFESVYLHDVGTVAIYKTKTISWAQMLMSLGPTEMHFGNSYQQLKKCYPGHTYAAPPKAVQAEVPKKSLCGLSKAVQARVPWTFLCSSSKETAQLVESKTRTYDGRVGSGSPEGGWAGSTRLGANKTICLGNRSPSYFPKNRGHVASVFFEKHEQAKLYVNRQRNQMSG